MNLVVYGRDVTTVFDLLGSKENDMTFSLGWVLSRSPVFLRSLVEDLYGRGPWPFNKAVVRMQTGRGRDGITDIEIHLSESLALIIEAKKGPELPGPKQLQKYARVLASTSAQTKGIAALTNSSPTYGATNLQCPGLRDTQLQHRSWRQIRHLAAKAATHESHDNKRWLRSFVEYLGGLLEMEMRFSNKVYVVSLSGHPQGWTINYRQIVEEKGRYFFPVGTGGWPDPPPNYLGFRYDGQLQSIHHVKRYDTFTRPNDFFEEASADIEWGLHYCVELGPAIRPAHTVRNGPRVQRAARVYCLIDTLLTCETISDALTETHARERNEE